MSRSSGKQAIAFRKIAPLCHSEASIKASYAPWEQMSAWTRDRCGPEARIHTGSEQPSWFIAVEWAAGLLPVRPHPFVDGVNFCLFWLFPPGRVPFPKGKSVYVFAFSQKQSDRCSPDISRLALVCQSLAVVISS